MFARILGLKTISPRVLHQLMQNTPVVAIDVNSPHSWVSARVPRARNLDPVAYSESDLPQLKDSMLVFYCSNFMCRKAPNAARRAKSMGYNNVHVMSVGISGWVSAKFPTESGPAA